MTRVNVDLARLQFALTSIYHFLFVPVTIGLSFLVAVMQTLWHRSGEDEWRRLTRFFGNLLLINVAVGVVTGLVQEFEFGMNWSAWSRYVGDVFGGPLAMEGLAAFFLESTFLGLWLFGWDRLARRVHLFCIWMVALGATLSARVHHGRQLVDAAPGRVRGRHATASRRGSTTSARCSPTRSSCGATSTSCWPRSRPARWCCSRSRPGTCAAAARSPRSAAAPGWRSPCWSRSASCWSSSAASSGVIETRYQPMKIAAAEAQWETCQPCSFSAFQIGGGNNDEDPTKVIAIPHLLSILATLKWDGQVVGLNELQAQYEQQYGPGNYIPNVFIQYWSMRVMAYLGDRRRPALAVGRVAAAPAAARALEVVPARRRRGRCSRRS